MVVSDTILAIGSPYGPSPRALLRVSGPGVGAIEHRLGLRVLDIDSQARTARRVMVRVTASEGALSIPAFPALALRFVAPASFTGEDMLELLIPGHPVLVRRVMDAMLTIPGVRQAGPGEFSARAYLHGKLSIDQAEGLASLIAAEHEDELDMARGLLSGAFGAQARGWADEIATLLALVEAGIDFTDQEDVRPITPARLRVRAEAVRQSIDQAIGVQPTRRGHRPVPRVVLVGEPNSGKSTLFNALLGRNRAIVSPIAGTTRDVLIEPLDLSLIQPGVGVIELADAAGLEEAAASSETDRRMQQATLGAIQEADVLVHCDPLGTFSGLGTQSVGLVGSAPVPAVRVMTKADLHAPLRRPHSAAGDERLSSVVRVCALTGFGLAELREAIASAAFGTAGRFAAKRGVLYRHGEALRRVQTALARSIEMSDAPMEMLAVPLRDALDAVGELTGSTSSEDILGRIFGAFCIGK